MTSRSDALPMSLIRLTRPQFDAYMRPQLQSFLTEHAGDPAAHTIDADRALSDLYDLVHGQSTLEWNLPPGTPVQMPDIAISSACAQAVVGVAVGCVALVFQAAGVPSSVTRAVGTTVVSEAIAASPALVTGLQAEVTALMQAKTVYTQATAIFSLFGSIGNVIPIPRIIAAIKSELSWYQWVLMGVIITAQLTLWFSTGGVAAIAELVLFGGAVAGLAVSATSAYSVCNSPTTELPRMNEQPEGFVFIDVGTAPFAMLATGQLFVAAEGGFWVNMDVTVEDFSAGLRDVQFPGGQLWVIGANGGADGPISYLDPTGHKISTGWNASLISTGDDGETWATQSDGTALRWNAPTRQWGVEGNNFDQIVVSSSQLQWALVLAAPTRSQTLLLRRASPVNTWMEVAGPPEATDILQIATNSAGDLVCVTTDNRVFQYVDEGSTWVQLGGNDIAAQSICIRDPDNAWLIDTSGQAQALGPLLNPSANPGLLQWDTEDVWDETKSTHLYLVNRAALLVATSTDPAYAVFVQQHIQPMVGQDKALSFRKGLCQGIYDADFLAPYNNPNWLTQPTWKSHFYDASTGKNYLGETIPTALSNGVSFVQQSLTCLSTAPVDLYRGGYFLGLALHYFTDLTQPMHAANYTYLSSFPFGYHTDFEAYTMSMQAAVTQPTVTGFQPGSVNDVATLYQVTAATFKQQYFTPIEQAHMYANWKWSPGAWQAAVLPLLPTVLNAAVSSTAQLLHLYFQALMVNGPGLHSYGESSLIRS